eukprot:g2708.t1
MESSLRFLLSTLYLIIAGTVVFILTHPLALHAQGQMLILAVLTVVTGCLHSLYLHACRGLEPELADDDSTEVLDEQDAMKMPIVGSCVLFGLFVVFKLVPIELIKQYIIPTYISGACAFALAQNMVHLSDLLLKRGTVVKTVLAKIWEIGPVTIDDIIAMIFAIGVVGIYWYLNKHWTLSNILGISFCILGMKSIDLSSFKTGAIMLVGLFVYDIFWVFGSESVFGSNVMVTVAKGVNAPILLKFPLKFDDTDSTKLVFSMLGLGDIVVPGLFLSLLARFDFDRIVSKKQTFRDLLFGGGYWSVNMIAYACSLVVTVAFMLWSGHAQPALLYIVPFCLITAVVQSMIKGEFNELYNYSTKVEQTNTKDKSD